MWERSWGRQGWKQSAQAGAVTVVQAGSDGGLDGGGRGRVKQMDLSVLETELIGLAGLLATDK